MNTPIAIVPRPLALQTREGLFTLTPASRILPRGAGAAPLAELLAEYLRGPTGYALPVTAEGRAGAADILLEQTAPAGAPDEAGFFDEAYRCDVGPQGAVLSAATADGLARALQTLRQLFPARVFAARGQAGPWTAPAVSIEDRPRFRWRGLHLDVGRHFFTVSEVQRFIDLAALHRFNRVHLHLTEDQGWRLEIRKYPRLTEVGSVRPMTLIGPDHRRPRVYDPTPYGGFYTQADIRALVAFAARRRIELVPEVDMPGHMQAAIAAYPELGNLNMALTPRCHWGISQHILNVEEGTVRFMQDVLAEVMELFPGRFIHIGGDEALKHEWAESARVQARMRELGVADEPALQSWFIRRMDEFIGAGGRRLIGWDEILEGGLAPGAAVMSWRGEQGGIQAAALGHDAVMAPGSHVYFDHYQSEPVAEEPLAIGGLTTTGHVYSYEPVPAAVPPERRHHVLGAQGQLWTEYIGTMDYLEYMTFPRACALAEVLWLPAAEKKYADFLSRLAAHRALCRAGCQRASATVGDRRRRTEGGRR